MNFFLFFKKFPNSSFENLRTSFLSHYSKYRICQNQSFPAIYIYFHMYICIYEKFALSE